AASVPEAKAVKRKLSFKEKHALESLPATIDKLHVDIARLQAKLASPGLFAKDPLAFNAAAAELKAAETAIATAEEQWLELEMLREELAL
ncbi:MAG: ABC transporter C-terminal domain-containing protein, partial [Hyphomicrobiaceae bacterium]